MKRPIAEDNATGNSRRNNDSRTNLKMKRNLKRMGGGGLSLEAFVNAKSRNDQYNPSLIKKQREFYKNAKCIRKYKKLKQQDLQNDPSASMLEMEDMVIPHEQQHQNKSEETSKPPYQKNRKNRKSERSLNELYERKREEDEKAKAERDAIVKAKREERERAEARRKVLKDKMMKKTKSGQPVMKYRIEHMLESIKGSSSSTS